jgi:anti-anti-sigma regulatory factor
MANFHILQLDGELDVPEKERIEQELGSIDGFGHDADVALDLTDAGFVDTTFINALIRVRNRTAHVHREGSIRIVAPRSSNVWLLFRITKLNGMFPLFDNMAAARPTVFTERRAVPRDGPAVVFRSIAAGLAIQGCCFP